MKEIRAVLFDWRGTLVVDWPDEWWIRRALVRLGRSDSLHEVEEIRDALERTARLDYVRDAMRIEDCSPALHREASRRWSSGAGLDSELADALYNLDFDPESHPLAVEVPAVLQSLRTRGIRVGVLSDVHFDLRPEFTAVGTGRTDRRFGALVRARRAEAEPGHFSHRTRAA